MKSSAIIMTTLMGAGCSTLQPKEPMPEGYKEISYTGQILEVSPAEPADPDAMFLHGASITRMATGDREIEFMGECKKASANDFNMDLLENPFTVTLSTYDQILEDFSIMRNPPEYEFVKCKAA